jgi:SWI/SNF-related matrix-associated actin-dependent regulator 1 of chromatin subfamily A
VGNTVAIAAESVHWYRLYRALTLLLHLYKGQCSRAFALYYAELKTIATHHNKSKNACMLPSLEAKYQKLYPYQHTGISYLLENPCVILGDEMGLGKTVQALVCVKEAQCKRVLVICPASSKHIVWKREAQNWIGVRARVFPEDAYSNLESPLWVINYDILEKYSETLNEVAFDALIIDEAHYMKNDRAKRTKFILSNLRYVPRKLLLTGTPLHNRPIELWSLLSFLDLKSWRKTWYKNRFCGPAFNGWAWTFLGATHLDELHSLISPYMIRRVKATSKERDWEVTVNLPPKRRFRIDCHLPKDLIDRTHADLGIEVYRTSEGKIEIRLPGIEMIHEAKQAFIEHKYFLLEALLLSLLEDETSKVVLFSQYRRVVAHFQAILTKAGLKSVLFTGESTSEERMHAVDQFQDAMDVRVFLGTKAAWTAITLTAGNTMLFTDLDWVPSNHDQAEGRLWRIGQQRSIDVYYTIVPGTIEEHIYNAIEGKSETIAKVVKGDKFSQDLATVKLGMNN